MLSGRPNVGALMAVCEENYILLRRLVPTLRQETGRLISRCQDALDLHLEIQEQTRYTTQARLTYVFAGPAGAEPRHEPNAQLRIYHDAQQVELLALRQSLWSPGDSYAHPALVDKWQANRFLAKWLAFCLAQGHRLGASSPALSSVPHDASRSVYLDPAPAQAASIRRR